MQYHSKKASSKFKMLFCQPFIKDVFGLNFENQLVGLLMFTTNYIKCGKLLVGPVIIPFDFEKLFKA